MDDINELIESQESGLVYQSETMTSVNPMIEENIEQLVQQQQLTELCVPPDENIAVDENIGIVQTDGIDGQSVSVSVDEISTTNENNSNEQTETNDSGNNVNATEPNDVTIKTQEENPPEMNDNNDGEAAGEVKNDENAENKDETVNEQNDNNIIATKADKKKEDEIDLNQCRICMSSSNLLDIFRIGEKTSFRICDLIMKLAPSVKISERDYLPHSVCSICVDRIEAAYELRVQCEETDKCLRSKLKRSKKTRRAPSEFVLIDCADSSSDSDDDQKSDDEFQLSNDESEESSDSDSDSSYDEKKKRMPSQRGRKRGPLVQKRSNHIVQPQMQVKKARNSDVVYIKASKSDDEEGTNTAAIASVKPVKSLTNRFQFRCDVCNRACGSAEALSQHRRTHMNERCNICSLVFRQRSALLQHMQKHREERICQKCNRVFATKIECQRHIQTTHGGTATAPLVCNACKRYFPNKNQMDAHKCNSSIITATSSSKRKNDVEISASGKDLFKSVAPLTTTYWSDSFSD